jgi:hypothetical protein
VVFPQTGSTPNDPEEVVMNRTYHTCRIRRTVALLAGLAGATLACITAAPAAFASTSPGPAGSAGVTPVLPDPARFHAALAGGMPGWQITVIAVGAAVLGAALAVLVDRARAARRQAPAAAA